MAEPDLLGALRAGGEEHLGRRGVRIFLEEVVLDLPDVVEAQPVGELDLVERVLEQLLLAPVVPRPRQLMLVENAEFHGRSPWCLCMIFSENRCPLFRIMHAFLN